MIFIDTAAFVARYLASDGRHGDATQGWRVLARRPRRCFTSVLVLSETITLLARRASPAFAVERARAFYSSGALEILRPDASIEREAIDALAKLADQDPSFTDCVSFVLMRRHRLRLAFTFDRHFAAAGFEIWPPP